MTGEQRPREPRGDEVRAAWEQSVYPATIARYVPRRPLEDADRAQVLRDLTVGYGDECAAVVIAAADGYFDADYLPDVRSFWLAVARELRGRNARDDRLLARSGVRSLGRVIL